MLLAFAREVQEKGVFAKRRVNLLLKWSATLSINKAREFRWNGHVDSFQSIVDAFDKFVVNYEDTNGNSKKFDLFDTKSEISVLMNLNVTIKTSAVYALIKDHFDTFLAKRYNA